MKPFHAFHHPLPEEVATVHLIAADTAFQLAV